MYEVRIETKLETGEWAFTAKATGTSVRDAVARAHVPLGWGGHGRSERQLDALAEGNEIVAPLGTYRLASWHRIKEAT